MSVEIEFMEYTVYLRESKYRFLRIGTIEERRKKEKGRQLHGPSQLCQKEILVVWKPGQNFPCSKGSETPS